METTKLFDTLKELVDHYQKNPGYLNKVSVPKPSLNKVFYSDFQAKFILKNPICQQRWEFLHSDVQVGKLIGEGAYGEVREGIVKKRNQTLEVAVKLVSHREKAGFELNLCFVDKRNRGNE